MSQVTASQVKELRERTGAGMIDCKKALEANDGDIEKAVEKLRMDGMAKADKKGSRVAAEGVIGSVADNVYSCMGAVYSKRRVDEELAPAMYDAFVKEGVEVAYLVPL